MQPDYTALCVSYSYVYISVFMVQLGKATVP